MSNTFLFIIDSRLYFKLVWKIKLFNYSKIFALHNANIIIVILRGPKAM